jgi:hypothetical protein
METNADADQTSSDCFAFNNYQPGVELLPSIVMWDAYTDEGFDNDVFGTLFMLSCV